VLGPKSNAHGPNEFLDIAYAQKLTACVAQVLAAHARA
jgi:di/tripeptidase